MTAMLSLAAEEAAWLAQRRAVAGLVLIGLDHHSLQFTVALAGGQSMIAPDKGGVQYHSQCYSQDGDGYRSFLADLARLFPAADPSQYRFVMEASFARTFCEAMLRGGFSARQLLWVRPNKLARFRKGQDSVKAGKNDVEDAKLLAIVAYEEAVTAGTHKLMPYTRQSAQTSLLRSAVSDYQRLKREVARLRTRIYYLVLELFPELREVWHHTVHVRKPRDGGYQAEERMDVCGSNVPLRLLYLYPSPQSLVDVGFDEVWESLGKGAGRKDKIRRVLELAATSGGIPDAFRSTRLQLLIQTLWSFEAMVERYDEQFKEILDADPVLASLRQIRFLSPAGLAQIVARLGEHHRFASDREVKRYLNIAPRAMPQTGSLDADGRPLQFWRMSANRYQRKGGRRELAYRSPGPKDVRSVLYLWFEVIMINAGKAAFAGDPFIAGYEALRAKHSDQKGWIGRIRWKLGAKLVRIIFHCISHQVCYQPAIAAGLTEVAVPAASPDRDLQPAVDGDPLVMRTDGSLVDTRTGEVVRPGAAPAAQAPSNPAIANTGEIAAPTERTPIETRANPLPGARLKPTPKKPATRSSRTGAAAKATPTTRESAPEPRSPRSRAKAVSQDPAQPSSLAQVGLAWANLLPRGNGHQLDPRSRRQGKPGN